ncbi:MAG: serine hydrolase [Anaerolineae bacterium]|nr:serine hydrolase [Anaerolineae bacterium]
MRQKQHIAFLILRFVALFLIFAAALLLGLQLVSYSRLRSAFPIGMKIAEVNVGGLNQQQAADRISQVYSLPVEVNYLDQVFQINPAVAGFKLDMEGMLTAADLQRLDQPFWDAFWDYLWGRLPEPESVPLRASLSTELVANHLNSEIAPRYNRPAVPAVSLSGSSVFDAGVPGTVIDVPRSLPVIEQAFFSATNRSANLVFNQVDPPRPSYQYLEALLKRKIELSDFDGIAEIYLLDLNTRNEVHFAVQDGEDLAPDIAFTAASTMKIPIMISVFIQEDLPLSPSIANDLQLMIEQSENTPSDRLMELLGGNFGPLLVTENIQNLGLKNTFISGFYYIGAPLLTLVDTPANTRQDIDVTPDVYNQTTSSEIGMLLDDLYQCADTGGGALLALYPDQITRGECQQMISYLAGNRIGVLIQAGLPDGTRIAHKHGWITEADGLIHTISDVGIIYSPAGNYVLCVYLWHPVQLYFDQANLLIAELSRVIYNYVNIE